MNDAAYHQQALSENGFSVIHDLYTTDEINHILAAIHHADTAKDTFRKSADLFAIRQFFKELPETVELVFNDNLKETIRQVVGDNFFVVKSLYFDKPETSNWYVAYHQDLTISVDKKLELDKFGPWTTKQNQFAVQPPIEILENIVTIRIHLDDTDEQNGALRVIPTSHLKKIYRPETINWDLETETTCCVRQGGIMLMKPLTLHSSGRTTNHQKRRVIHIEFSSMELPSALQWAERLSWR
ncbi:MAG: phytanoyl-CoA dioxygenase family protein [Bacteroidia bacterium]|nr:phytanoyl-CoA dioxygenase family protein [Bacteroidia bacterium]